MAIYTFPMFGADDPDTGRVGICEKCGCLTGHPDDTACFGCEEEVDGSRIGPRKPAGPPKPPVTP